MTNDDDDDPATHPELQKKGGGVISIPRANKGVLFLHGLAGKGRLMMQPVNGRCWGAACIYVETRAELANRIVGRWVLVSDS